MNILHIIIPILVGSVIGYCTNYIAIKMLFRPHKAIYIGKFRLPFTPGIIPKNQKRVAGAIGEAVSEQLLTKEAVMESIGEAGEHVISDITENIFNSDMSILEMLPKEAESDVIIESVSNTITQSLIEKANQLDLDSVITRLGQEAIGSLRRSNPMLAMLLNTNMQNAIYERLANAAREYINNRGEDVVKGFISDYIKELANKPAGELIPDKDDKDRLKAAVDGAAAIKHGSDLLDRIDIKGIVAKRIEEMKMDELEKLVLSVMKQELQAVINLGALIGAIIGIINVFI